MSRSRRPQPVSFTCIAGSNCTLQRLRQSAGGRPVGVRADKRVPYGEVLGVLDACRKAGWEDVTLIAARRNESG